MHTVDTEGYAGWPSSIAIDSINNIHISYCVSDEELKYATNASGAWIASTIDSAGAWFSESSIVIDSNDKVHICYRVTPIYKDLKYATNTSGAWVTCCTIDSVPGSTASIGIGT